MKRSIRMSMIGTAVLASAMPLTAQQAKPTVFDVTPYAGYMMFGKLFTGPVGTSISAGSGPVYGAQMSLTMAKNVALYGNVGYSSSDLKIGLPIIGGLDVGSSKALMYDGGVDVKLSPNFGVRLMAKDYLGKFDFKEATSFDLNGKTTNNVALTLGVHFGF